MIAQITGTLTELDSETNTVLLAVGDIGYELMVPGYAVSDLSQQLGRSITLHCLEYFEGSGGVSSNNFVPRILGFPQAQDKMFFQRFISVKGIGIRKALRCLTRVPADIAFYIEEGDAKMLATLPEIGKRTSEQIIAELKGKVSTFALAASHIAEKGYKPMTSIEKEALEVLLQLGERRNEAEELIRQITRTNENINTTDALVQAVYRIKAGNI